MFAQSHRQVFALAWIALFSFACWAPVDDAVGQQPESGDKKISSFGEYQGYSKPEFDKWTASSQYVTMRDGVKLAVDIVRPSKNGKCASPGSFPVVWTHSRYHRNQQPQLPSIVDSRPDLQRLAKHGYAIVAVGVRGSGASFGQFEGLMSPNETKDAYEVIDWISKQPWCDGNIGMFGESYLGMTQYMAASGGHPALKAIFPSIAGFDLYDTIYPGGVFRVDMINHWDQLTRLLDTRMKPARVDTDQDGSLLEQAIAEHEDNWEVLNGYDNAPFRDSRSKDHSYATHNLSPFLKQINQAKVPAYHWNGFYDLFVLDSVLWYANYHGPQKLGIGPWPHSTYYDRRFIGERFRIKTIEQHRWFDHWLKGIDNGIMNEPPVYYAILKDGKDWSWESAQQWPPATSQPKVFYLHEGKSGSVASVNDGRLILEKPAAEKSFVDYKVDSTTTTGNSTRWDNAVGQGPMRYRELWKNDKKSLTFTTAPLEQDLVVTGHPVATLYVSCSAEDCDFIVLLAEVDEDGKSQYVTEGVLRASQRQLREAPWNNLGLPFQRCFRDDQQLLRPGEIVELKLDLHPTSLVFNTGHCIRLTIMCADKDNAEFLENSTGAEVTVQHNNSHLSNLVLPVAVDQER